ncbi:hypothetical protein E4T42_00432 [Aureobasidium subglaciale]|nr:hypothetical protein E4T42_00432 [Aureobasidium subglaciale]
MLFVSKLIQKDLVDTVHKVQYDDDDDPFPGAIFGMTLPSTSGLTKLKSLSHMTKSDVTPVDPRADTKALYQTMDNQAPFSDVASSRNSGSPFSHQSTPTSASSHSSLATSALGSARHRDSLDLARIAAKTQARKENKASTTNASSSLRKETMRPSASDLRDHSKGDRGSSRQRPTFLNPFSAKAASTGNTDSSVATKAVTRRTPRGVPIDGIPPEFAHLNVDPPQNQSTRSLIPPRRPSRDGIDGPGLSLDVPVVQSNLSHVTRVSSRGPNDATPDSPPQSPRRTFGFSNRSSSRQSNKSQTYPTTPRTPVDRSEMGTPLSRKDSPMLGTSPNASSSPRIDLLSSRYRDSPTHPIVSEKPKKGPAAGTGHEGYGKFGFRGRGSSIFGRTSRSSSKDSSTSHKGLSFLSRKKGMTEDHEDGIDQFLEERREPIILRGKGRGSNADEQELPRLVNPGRDIEVGSKDHSSISPRTAPVAYSAKPALPELAHEGKEGHWLGTSAANKSPTLIQRFKSKITNQSSRDELGKQSSKSLHFGSIDQATDLELTDIEKLFSGGSRSSHSSKDSDTDSKSEKHLVPYSRRHEGLLPSPLDARNLKRTSVGSPVLLQAKTITQVKAPQLVNIPKAPGSPRQGDVPQVRLRSVGRIPEVVRNQIQSPLESTSVLENLLDHNVKDGQFTSIADDAGEFLAFPPRKDSELSYTSSSGLGSPHITRSSFVGEDEVWNEYDNLLDEVLPQKVRASTTSSLGAPFQYGDMVDHKPIGHNAEGALRRTSESRASKRGSDFDTSRPSTTFSISDYLVDREDAKSEAPVSPSKIGSSQVGPTLWSPKSPRKSFFPKQKIPVDTSASAELRFAALMTSKWLSFGRLLFSPAHEEAMTSNHTRILIVDGLGKEWSYNCALTYPKCQFYNLGPEPNSSSWETLSNHHHVTHPSVSASFPFPNNYFSAVVFRFPIAAADDAYQACFNEIKRTLRPSGYLEMSVLDLDLVNMGHIARKTVRDLKIRIHQQDSQISLWNHGDAFLTLLGKREFENLRKCVVGIPVAGRIRRSHDSGSSSSGSQRKRTSEQPEPEYLRFTEWMQSSNNKNNEEDEHHERRNDEDITKTVAKIGRWWYSSCYPDPGRSTAGGLWDTPGLLRECERQRTSFRLLFCYAQKPVCVKRRTASV